MKPAVPCLSFGTTEVQESSFTHACEPGQLILLFVSSFIRGEDHLFFGLCTPKNTNVPSDLFVQ